MSNIASIKLIKLLIQSKECSRCKDLLKIKTMQGKRLGQGKINKSFIHFYKFNNMKKGNRKSQSPDKWSDRKFQKHLMTSRLSLNFHKKASNQQMIEKK